MELSRPSVLHWRISSGHRDAEDKVAHNRGFSAEFLVSQKLINDQRLFAPLESASGVARALQRLASCCTRLAWCCFALFGSVQFSLLAVSLQRNSLGLTILLVASSRNEAHRDFLLERIATCFRCVPMHLCGLNECRSWFSA